MATEHASKGLLYLMLRLSSIRGELQLLHAHDESLRDLAIAYGEALEMLAKLDASPVTQAELIGEYQTICSDIEDEVARRCAGKIF